MENEKQDIKIVLEQWKICVEMANSISQRRYTMNNFFVSLNVVICTIFSLVKEWCVIVPGIIVCLLWLVLVCNFRLLNKAKYDVINEIEERLPVQPFRKEWKIFKRESRCKYFEMTVLEQLVPLVLLVAYVILLIIYISRR